MSNAAKAVKAIRTILGGAAVAAIMSVPAHAGVTAPPSINIEKLINDADADDPGTAVNVAVGDPLTYKFRLTNDGGGLIFGIIVTDTFINLSPCNFPTEMVEAQTIECSFQGIFLAEPGEHFDIASVNGFSDLTGAPVSDTDSAFYFAPVPNAVPEPATLALLGLGLAGLGFSRRRKLN